MTRWVLCILAMFSTATMAADVEFVRGVYGDLKPFWDKGAKLNDYGVNAVFVRSGSINDELIKRARAEGCKVFAEFATLNGGYHDWVAKHPDAYPIDDEGKLA